MTGEVGLVPLIELTRRCALRSGIVGIGRRARLAGSGQDIEEERAALQDIVIGHPRPGHQRANRGDRAYPHQELGDALRRGLQDRIRILHADFLPADREIRTAAMRTEATMGVSTVGRGLLRARA
jgi:hypothetical protein